jgi:hypothetical protein
VEVIGFAVVAADDSPVALEPGQARLDDLSVPAESLGGVDALTSDPNLDAAAADLGAERGLVVRLVRVQLGRPPTRPALGCPDGR